MVTKEQALKRVEELEARVDERLAAEKALRLGAEKEVEGLRESLEQVKGELLQEKKRADALLSQRDELQRRLDGFGDLAKALGKVRGESGVDRDQVRALVVEEVAKVMADAPVGGAGGVSVTKSVPYVELKVSRPWLTLDETVMEGRITVLALGRKLPESFVMADVLRELEVQYGWRPSGGASRNRLKEAMEALVGKYKLLERVFDSHNKQYVYSVRKDAESRVKESETREAVDARE
jgi:hypothetical protein